MYLSCPTTTSFCSYLRGKLSKLCIFVQRIKLLLLLLSKHIDWIDDTHFVSFQALCILSNYNVSIMLKSLSAANSQ